VLVSAILLISIGMFVVVAALAVPTTSNSGITTHIITNLSHLSPAIAFLPNFVI
jgi:hypothetical protein